MDNIKENKKINYIYKDKQYTRDPINSINHTNINNNINITNYYPPPSQNFCNKQTFTFIDENGSVQNAISYPIKTATHKTKKLKDSSPTPNVLEKKYHHCQSPYMKKILPSSKRQKSKLSFGEKLKKKNKKKGDNPPKKPRESNINLKSENTRDDRKNTKEEFINKKKRKKNKIKKMGRNLKMD